MLSFQRLDEDRCAIELVAVADQVNDYDYDYDHDYDYVNRAR
jgi:hypothetical protein